MAAETRPAADPLRPGGTAVTVRGLAPEMKARLRIRAAHNARSMDAEARAILEAALAAPEEDQTDLAAFARALFTPLGGMELELPERELSRDPPSFGEGEGTSATRIAPAPRPAGSIPKRPHAATPIGKRTKPPKGSRR